MSDVKHCEESKKNYTEVWDQEVRELWPESYPLSLSSELKKLNVNSILDCAGGTGYPAIELKQMGWDISYSDGWDAMQRFFNKRLQELKLDMPQYLSRWESLSENIPNTYDALLCSGNSFVGINAYDNDSSVAAETVKSNMMIAVSEFYKILNTGGVLFIDLFNRQSSAPEQPYCMTQTNDTHHIFTTISYDPFKNVRTNLTTKTSLIDCSEVDTIVKVTPLFSQELINLLLDAGFSRVEPTAVNHADYVDSFFAFKD